MSIKRQVVEEDEDVAMVVVVGMVQQVLAARQVVLQLGQGSQLPARGLYCPEKARRALSLGWLVKHQVPTLRCLHLFSAVGTSVGDAGESFITILVQRICVYV